MSDTIKQAQDEQDLKTRVKIFQAFDTGDTITIPLIQRRCSVGYNTAYRTLNNLIEDGLVEPNGKLYKMC